MLNANRNVSLNSVFESVEGFWEKPSVNISSTGKTGWCDKGIAAMPHAGQLVTRPLRFPEGRISLSEQLFTVMLDGLLTSLQVSFADDPPHPYHFPLQLMCWDGFEGPCPSLEPP